MAVPGAGWFAICRDPHGNQFGLWQRDPEAQPPSLDPALAQFHPGSEEQRCVVGDERAGRLFMGRRDQRVSSLTWRPSAARPRPDRPLPRERRRGDDRHRRPTSCAFATSHCATRRRRLRGAPYRPLIDRRLRYGRSGRGLWFCHL